MDKIIFDNKSTYVTYPLRHDDTSVPGGWRFPNTRNILLESPQFLAAVLGKPGFEFVYKLVILLLYGLQSNSNLVGTVDR